MLRAAQYVSKISLSCVFNLNVQDLPLYPGNACAEALLECYRTASIFGWPCKDENKAFWDCYTRVRVSHCFMSPLT